MAGSRPGGGLGREREVEESAGMSYLMTVAEASSEVRLRQTGRDMLLDARWLTVSLGAGLGNRAIEHIAFPSSSELSMNESHTSDAEAVAGGKGNGDSRAFSIEGDRRVRPLGRLESSRMAPGVKGGEATYGVAAGVGSPSDAEWG